MLDITKEFFDKSKVEDYLKKYATLSIRHLVVKSTISNIDIENSTDNNLLNHYGTLQATLWNITKEMDRLRKLVIIAAYLCDEFKDIIYVLSNDHINGLIFKNLERHYKYYLKNFDNDDFNHSYSSNSVAESHTEVYDYYTDSNRINYVTTAVLHNENCTLKNTLRNIIQEINSGNISQDTLESAKLLLS